MMRLRSTPWYISGMGARGPQPKPTYLRQLEGNPSGKPFNPAEAKVPTVLELTPPSWFDLAKRRKWNEVCAELAVMGGLSSVDYQMLTLYVDTLSELERIMKKMQEVGETSYSIRGVEKTSSSFQQAVTLKTLALRFAQVFGMTPSARARIVFLGSGGGEEKPDNDPFAC